MKVVIIGAGIVGTSAALTLAEAGVDVTVVERGLIAGEASGLNAGVIGGGGWGDRPTVDVALRMGSRERYVDLASRGREIGLDLSGTLTLIRTEQEWNWAAATVEADRQNGHCYELIDAQQLAELEPAADPALLGAIFDPMAARAEPVASTQAFAAEAVDAGARIESACVVLAMRSTPAGAWEVQTATTTGTTAQVIGADAVVIAAGPWCAEVGAMVGVGVPVVAVRGQMWATDPQPPLMRHAIAAAESSTCWDDEDPASPQPPKLTHRDGQRITRHLYGRQRPNGEVIFGGDRVLTNDRTVDDEGITINHGHVGELLPAVGACRPVRTWAGLMPFSLDGRPIFGPVPERDGLFLAGGLASSGFGRGPMTGQLTAELVLGRTVAYDLTSVLPQGRVRLG